jgi:prepilin-type N-terminal cleavage/methylation domain-containing protein
MQRRRPEHSEAGFTLLELMVVLVVLPLIMGGIAAVVIAELNNTSQSDQHGTFTELVNSHDAQITSAYFVRDVQSSTQISTNPAPLCGTGNQILGLSWSNNGTLVNVSYGVPAVAPFSLVRRYCQGTSPEVDSTVSHGLFPPTLVTPLTITNTGCVAGVSSCIQNGATTYVKVTMNCANGTITCADGGAIPVVKPSSGSGVGGVLSVSISVNENQTTNYQYTLTGVPRLANSVSSGNPGSGPPYTTFISNGQVTNDNCQSIANGIAVINDPSGPALTVKNGGSFSSTGIYTTGGSVPSGYFPIVGPPIPSPYDSLSAPVFQAVVTQIDGSAASVSAPTTITSVQLAKVPIPLTAGETLVLFNGTQSLNLNVTGGPYSATSAPTTISVASTPANATYLPGTATGYLPGSATNAPVYIEPSNSPKADNLDLTKTLPTGVYVWTNGINLSGKNGFDGSAGVLFYVTGGSVSLGGSGQTNLVPLNPDWEVTPSASVTAINGSTSAIGTGSTISSLTLGTIPMAITVGDNIVLSNGTSTLTVKATSGATAGVTATTIKVSSATGGSATANATYIPGSSSAFDQPNPEVVLWISRGDTNPNPPTLDLNGSSGTITLQGGVYAPTASARIEGGGNAKGASVSGQALDVGTVSSCSGGGAGIDISAGSQLTSGTVGLPSLTALNTGQTVADTVTVTGVGHLAPTGYAWVYVCGPYVTEPTVDPTCTDSTTGVNGLAINNKSVALTPNSTTGTAATTVNFTPTTAGYYCFASYYSSDQKSDGDASASYYPSLDTTTDGCFQVSPVLAISQPSPGGCFASVSTPGCTGTLPLTISGTTSDTGGPGINQVSLTVQAPNGKYWNPATSSFSSSTSVALSATTPDAWADWTYQLPATASEFTAGGLGTYKITAVATDSAAKPVNSQIASETITWNG